MLLIGVILIIRMSLKEMNDSILSLVIERHIL